MEQIVRQYRQLTTQSLRAHHASLSVDQWVVLKQISENNGSSQVEIGSSTVKDAPTTTRIIDQLVGKNLVSKQLDPEDRRRYMVFVTEKGRQLIERLMPVVQEYRQVPLRGFWCYKDDRTNPVGVNTNVWTWQNIAAFINSL